MFKSIDETSSALGSFDYLADDALATSLFLALRMGRPLFLEGAPGVGKTELAKVVSLALDTALIRLQCYEGLDLNHAVYEWNYPRQLLEIQADRATTTSDLFSEAFLLKRPLLQSIDASRDAAAVLLIDELDRADEEFESFLLELLSDFQITIPELGTLRATHRPIVVLTSNRTRDIHDALKRRCIYHWIDYPDVDKETDIVRRKVPGLNERIARDVVTFVQALRGEDLYKLPGIAETLDWAEALLHLGAAALDERTLAATVGLLLKHREDIEQVRGAMGARLLSTAGRR